jgi:hypothetical protein
VAALKSARPRLVEGFESPARAELALRIAERDTLVSQVETLRANFDGFDKAVWRARELEESAEKAIAAAIEAGAQHAVALLHDPNTPAPMTAREARAALEAAQDTLAGARRARDLAQQKIAESSSQIEAKERKVFVAASAVLLEGLDVDAILEKVTALQKDLLRVGGVLQFLVLHHIITDKHQSFSINKTELDSRIFAVKDRLESPPTTWNSLLSEAGVLCMSDMAALTWGAALEALKKDPNAPLPEKIA